MQVLVLIQYSNRYNANDAELLVEARVHLEAYRTSNDDSNDTNPVL